MQRKYSLRKLSIGLASVAIGIGIINGTGQSVKADTVKNTSTNGLVTPPRNDVNDVAISQNIKEDPNQVQGVTSKQDKTHLHVESNNVSSDASQGENEAKPESQNASTNQNPANSQEVNDSKDLGAAKSVEHTSSLQESNNQSNTVTEKTVQHDTLESGQKAQSFNLPKNSQKLNPKVLATNLIETNSLATTNGGFDEATWGKLDVTKWQGSVQDGVYQLTNYNGDLSHIIVPNEADFEQAGKSTNGLQVGITRDTVQSLLSRDQTQTIAFSKTSDQKVKAIGTNWLYAFSSSALSKFDGSNFDVSNVTNMNAIFSSSSISDLTSLDKWDTSKVTNMSYMFSGNKISNLAPLANWDVSKVTNMWHMFASNSISDLTPLTNWDTSKVTDMSWMFYDNSISDLTPLAKWDVSKVTKMNSMFNDNSISDLTPLTHWDTSKVTNMNWMFSDNSISDLTPLTNWNTSNATDMGIMFARNPDLIDLSPIANWNISGYGLFYGDTQLNLTNINSTPLMQGFLKKPDALGGAIFITNNADLVKATINKDLPNLTNTAKRTITFNIPHATPKTIVQIINYKPAVPVQVQVSFNAQEIVKTYPVKDSDWQLDTSKPNDAIIVNGQIHFKAVKIPHVNGYKAHLVRNKINPASFMVSFFAIPTENKPSTPIEVTPSKPSANPDNTNKPADDLQKRVITKLNSKDSGWTIPNTQPATYTVEVPTDDAIIDLSDLVIAEPVHAQTTTQIRVTKRFKLSKKHLIKHLKHRKRVSKLFSKRYSLL